MRKYLLKRDASKPYRRWVLEEVSKEANDDELSEMLNFCVDDQVDSMLTTVVGRHLWKCVDYLLNREVSSTRKTWAMEEACENAPEQTLLDILGRHSVEECYDSALVATLRRCLLGAACLLLSQLADEHQIRIAVKKAADTLTQGERDKVVVTAFNLHAWDVAYLVLEHVRAELKEQIVDLMVCSIDFTGVAEDSVFYAVIQHCNSSLLMRILSEAVKRRQISTARDVLRRIGQYGDPLVVTDDGRTVLQVVTETELSMNCRRQLVAECIKLGVSTHQPPVTDSVQRPPDTSSPSRRNTDFCWPGTSVSSPLSCAVLQPDLTLAAMLWESGSCSPKELHTVIDSFTMSTNCADPDTPDTAPQDIVSYLKTAASTPRSLESACRLVISHHLGVGCRRHESVKQLPLPDKLCNYVLFSDLVDPETSASAQQGDGSGTDQAGVSSTGDVIPKQRNSLHLHAFTGDRGTRAFATRQGWKQLRTRLS